MHEVGCSWQPLEEGDEMPVKTLKCLAKSKDFERKLSRRFSVSEDVGSTGPPEELV